MLPTDVLGTLLAHPGNQVDQGRQDQEREVDDRHVYGWITLGLQEVCSVALRALRHAGGVHQQQWPLAHDADVLVFQLADSAATCTAQTLFVFFVGDRVDRAFGVAGSSKGVELPLRVGCRVLKTCHASVSATIAGCARR